MKKKAFIFDIDNTLARRTDRDVYDFANVHLDEPIENVVSLYKILRAALPEYAFIIVTGRDNLSDQGTKNWLSANNINFDFLWYRNHLDNRSDTEVKREIYDNHIEPYYEVVGIFEDRLRICRMWHELGLTVFRVGDPDADL